MVHAWRNIRSGLRADRRQQHVQDAVRGVISGLKRVGQLLRAVEDGDHVNAISHHPIDQAMREDD